MIVEAEQGLKADVPAALKWCVGKFVYVRGSELPLHFMELKRFIIDDAIDYSHLFYLRALRARLDDSAYLDNVLRKWMDGTAVQAIAEAAAHAATGLGESIVLGEFSPGAGLTGEYVKLLLERGASDRSALPTLIRYEGYGVPAYHNRFEILHRGAGCDVAYCGENEAVASGVDRSRHVLVLNQNQSLRMDDPGGCSLNDFLALHSGGKVIALRVTLGEATAAHTTVKGRVIELPAMSAVLTALRSTGQAWHTRLVHGFDEGFLIPDGGEACGLLIGYVGVLQAPLGKFAQVPPNR